MHNFEKGVSTLVVTEDDVNTYSINDDEATILVISKNGISIDIDTSIGYLTIPAGIVETEGIYNEEAIITLDFTNNSDDTTIPDEGTGGETTDPENGTTTEGGNESVETPGSEEVETGTTTEGTGEETTTPEEENTMEETVLKQHNTVENL